MNTMALLREIINANNARQHSARELNRLAGKTIFPVLSDAEMLAFVTNALAGATSVSTIANLESLRLPALDQKLVAEIRNSNLTSMMLLGEIHYIDYSDVKEPKVSLYLDGRSAQLVGDLDDNGIFLPDGRQVAVQVHIGFNGEYTSKDIPTLKRKLRDYILDRVWNHWTRPPLPTPNYLDENSTVADVAVAQWGTCPVTREAMLAYGTVRGVGSQFEAVWLRDREAAEQAREMAVTFLDGLRLQQADTIARRRKKQEHADVANLLHGQLVALEQDMAMLPTGDKTYARVKEHLAVHAQTNFNKAAAAMKWNEQAREIITSGNRAIVRETTVLKAVLDLLFETLIEAPVGTLQDDALRQIEELSAPISPTLNAPSGAQRLMAIRVAVREALNSDASCDERASREQAA
ncbi:MAG: hypothetical protein P4L53_05065 [Candidatus Obscuribacterales bacterium]|nr:hypothetical protein [Candidatus Obscuribacterales bacterium]